MNAAIETKSEKIISKLKKSADKLTPFTKKKFDLLTNEEELEKWFSPKVGTKYKITDITNTKYSKVVSIEKQKNVEGFTKNIILTREL